MSKYADIIKRLEDATGLDVAYLEDARLAIARGKKDDAIHYIEHFLGREWIGRLQ